MNEETRIKLRETRRQMMADLESSMLKGKSPEDSIFYYHSSEDRIVLSHALFWVMTKMLDPKRDMLVLCPSPKERKLYFEVEERHRTKNRSFPIWHWMSISKKDILDYDRDDVSIDSYLSSQFDVHRNYRDEDPLLQEEELF